MIRLASSLAILALSLAAPAAFAKDVYKADQKEACSKEFHVHSHQCSVCFEVGGTSYELIKSQDKQTCAGKQAEFDARAEKHPAAHHAAGHKKDAAPKAEAHKEPAAKKANHKAGSGKHSAKKTDEPKAGQ